MARSLTRLLQAKGCAARLEEDGPEALQDPYSVRCTPQIAGVLSDALAWISAMGRDRGQQLKRQSDF